MRKAIADANFGFVGIGGFGPRIPGIKCSFSISSSSKEFMGRYEYEGDYIQPGMRKIYFNALRNYGKRFNREMIWSLEFPRKYKCDGFEFDYAIEKFKKLPNPNDR